MAISYKVIKRCSSIPGAVSRVGNEDNSDGSELKGGVIYGTLNQSVSHAAIIREYRGSQYSSYCPAEASKVLA